MLDWQVSRYVSPVLDFVHFIFSCTDRDLREKHYDELLNIYHGSLKELLDRLGGDTESQFPFTALLDQLKLFGKFGIIMASLVIPASSTKNEDLPDMDLMAETKDDPDRLQELTKAFTKGSDGAKVRLREALLDAMRFGYL